MVDRLRPVRCSTSGNRSNLSAPDLNAAIVGLTPPASNNASASRNSCAACIICSTVGVALRGVLESLCSTGNSAFMIHSLPSASAANAIEKAIVCRRTRAHATCPGAARRRTCWCHASRGPVAPQNGLVNRATNGVNHPGRHHRHAAIDRPARTNSEQSSITPCGVSPAWELPQSTPQALEVDDRSPAQKSTPDRIRRSPFGPAAMECVCNTSEARMLIDSG